MSVVFLTILVSANIYLSRRFGWILSMERTFWLHILFAVIPIFMMVGVIGFSNATTSLGSILYIIAAILMGFMLYLVLSLLVLDLANLFLKLKPLAYGISVISLTLVVSLYGIVHARNTRMSHIEVPISGLQQDLRLMHFSDIHLGHFRGREYLDKLVEMAKKEEPDLVVITGDLFDGRIQLSMETLEPLKKFSVPVYFVEGNHDKYTGVERIKEYLRQTGIIVLENEVKTFRDLRIIGLNHMQADNDTPSVPPNPTDISIKSVLSELDLSEKKPTILLHHSPDGVNHAHAAGVDLYLAGHTHAGQLFPVTLVNDLLFKYNKGLHDYKGTRIFVSRGAGTFGPPMRVGTRSEITLVKLLSDRH